MASTENKVFDRKHSIYKTKGSENPAFVLDKGIIRSRYFEMPLKMSFVYYNSEIKIHMFKFSIT